jgi:hypothetical protein
VVHSSVAGKQNWAAKAVTVTLQSLDPFPFDCKVHEEFEYEAVATVVVFNDEKWYPGVQAPPTWYGTVTPLPEQFG